MASEWSNVSDADDQPETVVQSYRMLSFWLNGVLSFSLVAVGVAGNTALISSFRYRVRQWLALYFYFFTFAVWNTGLLISTVLFNCVPALLHDYAANSRLVRVFLCYSIIAGYVLGNCSLTATVWLVMVVTVERYVAVARPFYSRLSSPRRRAKLVSLVLSGLVLLYNLPLLFEFQLQPQEAANGDSYSPALSNLRQNEQYILVYRIVCNLICLYLVPVLTVVIFTGKIVFTVSRSGRNHRALKRADRKSLNRQNAHGSTGGGGGGGAGGGGGSGGATGGGSIQDGSHQAHRALTFIVCKFLVCHTMPIVLNVLELMLDERATRGQAFAVIVDVSNLLVVGDSASNAFVYFSWRKRIRFFGLSIRKTADKAVKSGIKSACQNVKRRNRPRWDCRVSASSSRSSRTPPKSASAFIETANNGESFTAL